MEKERILVLDRWENDTAVFEDADTLEICLFDKNEVPAARPGAVFRRAGGVLTADGELTEKRKRRIDALANGLWAKK